MACETKGGGCELEVIKKVQEAKQLFFTLDPFLSCLSYAT